MRDRVAEGIRTRVTATAISPGYVDTDMTAWKHDVLDPAAMVTVADIAEMALAVTRLSRNAVVPNIVVARAGTQIWRASAAPSIDMTKESR